MPNRIIKESICTSDTIDRLSWFEEAMFYRLIVNCDDYGRFDGRIPVIKSRLFPLKASITDKAVADAIDKLSTVGLVMPYEWDGKPTLQLVTWDRHQSVRNKRSKYPAYDGSDQTTASDNVQLISSACNCKQLISDASNCSRNPIQSNTIQSESESESKTRARAKVRYAEFVSMTNGEYSSLVAELGEAGAKRCIEILDNYKGANGKRYSSDYRAILNWVVKRYREETGKGGNAHGPGDTGGGQEIPDLPRVLKV
jgi:hypothetical protein